MTTFLIRRILQMFGVVLLSATASYALLNLAPGGPLTGLRQLQQNERTRITAEDVARIRAYFELDLNLPVRFSRWLVGQPKGPIIIGDTALFADLIVGCRQPIEASVLNDEGNYVTQVTGCAQDVRLRDLVGRRVSRGVLLGDFGMSWKLLRDRPVSDLIASRLFKTVELTGLATLFSLVIALPLGWCWE